MNLQTIAIDKGNQIFHAKSWNSILSQEIILELILEAHKNINNKARLCLHTSAAETMQVTYLAFVSPYEDRVHCHPNRPEVLIPILGIAEARLFDDEGNLKSSQTMEGGSGFAISTQKGIWHSLKVLSSEFVMVEVGIGPFTGDSTKFFNFG